MQHLVTLISLSMLSIFTIDFTSYKIDDNTLLSIINYSTEKIIASDYSDTVIVIVNQNIANLNILQYSIGDKTILVKEITTSEFKNNGLYLIGISKIKDTCEYKVDFIYKQGSIKKIGNYTLNCNNDLCVVVDSWFVTSIE